MPGKTIGLSMNYGFAGTPSRSPDNIISSKPLDSASANVPFGSPVFITADDTYTAPAAGSTAAALAGIAVAEVRQLATYPAPGSTDDLSGYYVPDRPIDVLERGTVSVVCAYGDPAPLTGVYMRTALNGTFPTEKIGDLRAAADGGNTVQLTNCAWGTNRIDSNLITELKVKSVNV